MLLSVTHALLSAVCDGLAEHERGYGENTESPSVEAYFIQLYKQRSNW